MKKPKIQRLVIQHLEKVSGNVLEEYPEVIRAYIRRKGGVYALYKKRQLYYVGLASNLMARLKSHLRDPAGCLAVSTGECDCHKLVRTDLALEET
jgi:hypothetical protein